MFSNMWCNGHGDISTGRSEIIKNNLQNYLVSFVKFYIPDHITYQSTWLKVYTLETLAHGHQKANTMMNEFVIAKQIQI